MKPSGLDRLFKPQSIAVIGASTDPQKAGHVVIRHLLAGQFKGPILPVSPHSKAIAGVLAYAALAWLHPQRQFWHDAVCGTRLIHWKPARRS